MKVLGRPRCFDEEQAVDKAMHVFWEKGFEGASLADLTKAMGIKPASLYCAFGNKQKLFRMALAHYRAQELSFVDDILEEPTAYAVVKRLLRESAIFLTRPGLPPRCMTIQILAASEEGFEIQEELITMRNDTQKALRRRFTRAKREGDLPKYADAAGLARFVATVYQGMNIQSINGASRKELLGIADTSLRAWPSAAAA